MRSNQTPRILQQQPARAPTAGQQQSGSTEFQPQPQASAGEPGSHDGDEPMGEGSYEGTREYRRRTDDYLKSHDVARDADAARPRSADEAREMERAEEEGRSHSKGER